ncbi:unnamed protein product, partial [Pylaiella littoralis]
QIAQKEAEVADAVLQARKATDSRVRATGGRCAAGNELEEALLELTILKERSHATAESSLKTKLVLEQDVSAKRLDLLAASPPFILALEQALVTVASVDQAASSGPHAKLRSGRWSSTLKSLLADASDSIDHSKHLPGRGKNNKEIDSELTLAAASARRLSLHVNAWTTPQLSKELEGIWLQAVQAEAKADPQFRHVVKGWKMACESLTNLASTTQQASIVGEADQDAVSNRIRDCQVRGKIVPKVEKAGWWKHRQMRFLMDELQHIERKVAPQASPSTLAARYNLLLARCAEAGAWTTAVSVYRSARGRGVISCDTRGKRQVRGPSSLEPFVYQHLLRAAKNASPPQPRAAMLVLREMRLRGEQPAASHYNLVVSACTRAAAVAASTSSLTPLRTCEADSAGSQGDLRQIARNADGEERSRVGGDGANHGSGTRNGAAVAIDNGPPASAKRGGDHGDAVLRNVPPVKVALATARTDREKDGTKLRYLLTEGDEAIECQEAETAGNSWRLALEVVASMRKRGVVPTDVTFWSLVECCRCAAAAPSPKLAGGGEVGKGSTPAEVYTALKEAGIPLQFCYQAGLRNALKGGRCFPEYVAEITR